jgi:hypothetical protein
LKDIKTILISLLILALCFPSLARSGGEEDRLLDSASGMFEAMRDRDIRAVWAFLSNKSKATIVTEIRQTSARAGAIYSQEQITADMQVGGLIARTYWKAFLENFDPRPVLEESRWELSNVKKDRGEIVIQHKRAEWPARLKMYKENGFWKVGLVETFWSGKRSGIMLY